MDNKIKILAITKEKSASIWHRLIYPLNKVNGLEIEGKKIDVTFQEFGKNTLKEAENYNILMFVWNIKLSINELEALKAKGVKILYVLDDFWYYSALHPDFNNLALKQMTELLVKQYLTVADAVIVSTERLMLHAKDYNNNIAVLPNFINPVDFKIEEKTKSDKLRVGFVNSRSHYPDMLMFKQVLNRLAKNKKITDNVEFHIYGYVKSDIYWEEIISMFKKKKNISLVLKEYVPLEEYTTMYKDLDVCLLTLEYTEFNICRSALKLAECAITNTLPVGSSLYSAKELKGIVVAESPVEYEETLLKLLDKEYYNQVLKYVTEINLKDNNWEKRFENMALVLNSVYSEDLK